jgi:hypothetical protein
VTSCIKLTLLQRIFIQLALSLVVCNVPPPHHTHVDNLSYTDDLISAKSPVHVSIISSDRVISLMHIEDTRNTEVYCLKEIARQISQEVCLSAPSSYFVLKNERFLLEQAAARFGGYPSLADQETCASERKRGFFITN